MSTIVAQPYTHIASIYDDIMRDVDYEGWSDYIDEIIQHHHPDAVDLLELGCGTGAHAFMLEELDCYTILASDISSGMIEQARDKARNLNSGIQFEVADFLSFSFNHTFDAAFLVFDSINYVLDPTHLPGLFQSVAPHLRPGGIFIFDFTTTGFSERIEQSLNENRRNTGNTRYSRKSSWDPVERIHANNFYIEVLDPDNGNVIEQQEETHYQKIHTPEEIEAAIPGNGLEIEARYSDFDFSPVTEATDRITMVLRKCQTSR